VSSHLDSAKSCVDHALKRIRELEADIAAFDRLPPYVDVVEDDPQPGWKVRKVKFTTPIPHTFSHVAFDAVNQLRAALDQAGFAVAVASGASGKNAHFPFGDSLAEATSRKTKHARDIPERIFNLMLSFQPYFGGNNSLWGLNKLCNANKHEVTLAPVIKVGKVVVGSGKAVGPSAVCNLWDSASHELTLARFGPGGSVSANFNYSFSVLVGSATHINGKPVVQYLDEVAKDVERILSAVDGEAISMGLFI
jgi:hypothetical protein